MRVRKSKRIWFVALGMFVAVFLFTFLLQRFKDNEEVDAASLAGFDPGYIISDYQMSNYNSMSEADIQNFLNSKVSCNKDLSYYNYLKSRYPGFDWHFANNHIVCLPEERFGDGETIGSGETAARIIWKAAQDYRINPQVLIVLLQKEQGLITDSYPNTRQYRSATGYGCPDTAPCSSQYYGFKNQVRKAASMFRTVLDGGWTNYPLGNNYVQYNPDSSCGGSVVNIRSLATSALYRYTPYQPNAGALAAGYGTAPCGAYGNRNFYLYFQDWFGGVTSGATISSYYNKIGGENSILGKATSEEICGLIKGGCYRSYERGNIYWTANTGSWDVSGSIFQRWFKLGTEWGKLGYPISSEYRGLSRGGAMQKFEKGYIYYTPNTGAWEISGGIYDAWFKSGTEWGSLGYPTSGEKVDNNGTVYQEFEKGRIYWTAKDGAWIIPSWSLDRYNKLGAIKSVPSVAKKAPVCGLTKNGCYQAFKIGYIYYTPNTGAWEISGGIYDAWFKSGTEWGSLGYPTSGEKVDNNGTVYQEFEKGRIYWTAKDGAWIKKI